MPFTLRASRIARRASAVAGVALLYAAAPALLVAQMPAASNTTVPDPGFSFTPYLGMVLPTASLLATTATGAPLKLAAALTFGARLGIGLGDRVGLDGDVGYSPGSLEVDATGARTNQDVQTLTASGRLTFYLIPRSSPLWLGVSGGVGAVRHTFSNTGVAAASAISAGTNVGGVIGASAGIRLGKLLAINVGAEDYLYNASFDINGAKSAERKQHDIRLSAGIRIPFLGL